MLSETALRQIEAERMVKEVMRVHGWDSGALQTAGALDKLEIEMESLVKKKQNRLVQAAEVRLQVDLWG